MRRFAQLNKNGVAVGIVDTSGVVNGDNVVEASTSFNPFGKKYENGEWVDVPVEPIEPEPTQLDRIESMVAKSQEEIAQEARDAYTLELIEGGVIA